MTTDTERQSENWGVLWTFLSEPEKSWLAIQRIRQTAKNGGCCDKLFSENDFEPILPTSCCCEYGPNASEAVQKMAKDQKDYHKWSSCVTVC